MARRYLTPIGIVGPARFGSAGPCLAKVFQALNTAFGGWLECSTGIPHFVFIHRPSGRTDPN